MEADASQGHVWRCYWGWCRMTSSNLEELARHVKFAHFNNITTVKRKDWDIWLKSRVGEYGEYEHEDSTSFPSYLQGSSPKSIVEVSSPPQVSAPTSPTSPKHDLDVHGATALALTYPQTSPSPPRPLSTPPISRKRSFSEHLAQSSPFNSPSPIPMPPSPELADLIHEHRQPVYTPTTPPTPPKVTNEHRPPAGSHPTDSPERKLGDIETAKPILSHSHPPSRYSSNETSASSHAVEAHLTQISNTSTTRSPAQPEHVSVNGTPQDSVPVPVPDSPPPPPRRSTRARSRTPAPLPTVVAPKKKASPSVKEDEAGPGPIDRQPPPAPRRASSRRRATSEEPKKMPRPRKRAGSNSSTNDAKKPAAAVTIDAPIYEVEEDDAIDPPKDPEAPQAVVPTKFASGTLVTGLEQSDESQPQETQTQQESAPYSPVLSYPTPTWDLCSQFQIQTQAPYRSQTDSQSQ